MSDEATNGNKGEGDGPLTDVLTLRLRRIPWHLEVTGTCEKPEIMRVMLLEALRVVEQRLRLQDAAQIMAQNAEAQRVADLVARTAGRRG